MDTKEFLKLLSNGSSVSGHESRLNDEIISTFKTYADNIWIDKLGNIIILKRGTNDQSNFKIMVAAHMDEIGLMVKYIEDNGFLRFTNIGGIDPRTILGQEVIVHGNKDLFGVIGSKPPHLQEPSEINKAIKIEDMIIDIGYPKKEVEKHVSIGDPITIKRNFTSLQGNKVMGKSLDDKAGIAAMYECIKELSKINHEADIYFVSTVQEEVGMRGAFTSTYKINPDIGIAIDVGFGSTPELPKGDTIDMGKGPGITIGGNIHPGLRGKIVAVAKDYNIPFQFEVTPGPTGTDGRAMQITREGIPTLCLSIPLRYMHTSVEVIDMMDLKNTAKLLAFFMASISSENLEGLLCY
ncbi:putative enzyme [[Clostridium] ultunense Esp]|uniref:Putative enzyme n=1 Tax=[Clostridium] ultunense Esp TaxID=1288971 RepID=M1YQ60_9FIRM|nr:M42 family metallopeptidase [Schnuerera ultunensis]CCQ92680.1 putative enzyme [[Clostridium] ultunense Esp]SHD77109.1 putative enzyme [[Clostridium] ultunense Esp]